MRREDRLILGILLPVAGLAGVTAEVVPWACAWIMLLGAFVVACLVSWYTSRDPFAPLLPVAGYLFLGIGVRGLALREGWVPNPYSVPVGDQGVVVGVFLLTTVAMISTTLGYRSATGLRLGQRWKRRKWSSSGGQPYGVRVWCVLSAAVGVASLLIMRNRFGGVPGFGAAPSVVVSQIYKGGLFWVEMLAFFPLSAVFLAWGHDRLGVVGRTFLCVNFMLVLAWFVVAGRKSLLFELMFGLLVLRHYLRRRIRGRVLIVALVPALLVVSFAFYFKDYGLRVDSITAQYSHQSVPEAVAAPLIDRSYDFDAATMIVSRTRSVEDYRLGSTFDDLLWFYVPRQWWPDKPLSFGYTFAGEFFPGANLTSSYTPSMVGELYLDFGVIGVILGFYMFGLVLRATYEALVGKGTHLGIAVYIIVLFRLTNMIEGPITTHIEFLLAELLPVAVFVGGRTFLRLTGDDRESVGVGGGRSLGSAVSLTRQ